jgi:fatty acid desaturase
MKKNALNQTMKGNAGELKPPSYYQRIVQAELPQKVFAPDRSAFWVMFLSFSIFVGLCAFILKYEDWISWAAIPLFSLIAMFFATSLGVLTHEFAHFANVRNPILVRTLQYICQSPLAGLMNGSLWHVSHVKEHHTNSNTKKDRDRLSTLEDRDHETYFVKFLSQYGRGNRNHKLYTCLIGMPLNFFLYNYLLNIHSVFNIQSTFNCRVNLRTRIFVGFMLLLNHIVVVGFLVLFGGPKFIIFYALTVYLSLWFSSSMTLSNHTLNIMSDEKFSDPLAQTLSLKMPWLMDFFLRRFSHHSEHHLFPTVGGGYLPLVREKIKKHFPDRYHELPLWEAIKMVIDRPYLYKNNVSLTDLETGKIAAVPLR